MSLLSTTFTDPDGSLSLPEIFATMSALTILGSLAVVVAAAIRQVWIKDVPLDYAGFGTAIGGMSAGIATVVGALGAAQRMRDGQFKHEDQQ